MSETPVRYLLNPETNHVTLDAESSALRSQLRDIKRQLISLLVTVDRALGEEPSVITRSERRRG